MALGDTVLNKHHHCFISVWTLGLSGTLLLDVSAVNARPPVNLGTRKLQMLLLIG